MAGKRAFFCLCRRFEHRAIFEPICFKYYNEINFKQLLLLDETDPHLSQFKDLFWDAKDCRKIVIRNHKVCLGNLVDKMERLGNELKIPWKVEGRAEDFFGRPQS